MPALPHEHSSPECSPLAGTRMSPPKPSIWATAEEASRAVPEARSLPLYLSEVLDFGRTVPKHAV